MSEQAARAHADALGPRVAATLRASQGGDLEVGELSIMPGGHSGLTYRLSAGAQDLVVKAVPPGQRSDGTSRHAATGAHPAGVGRHRRAGSRRAAVDEQEPAWFAMDLVAGESLEPVLDDPPVEPVLAAARMRRAAEVLPVMHAVPAGMLPVDGPPLTPADELARWIRTMDAVPPELVPRRDRFRRSSTPTFPEGR